MTEVTLTDGTIVKCRKVPPYAYDDVIASIPRPEYPKVQLKSVDGSVQERPALGGSPELDAFERQMAEYNTCVTLELKYFRLGFGVLAWKRLGASKFVAYAPKEWTVPEVMKRFGVEPGKDAYERKVQYIMYELVQGDADDKLLTGAIEDKPITRKEVATASTPLQSTG